MKSKTSCSLSKTRFDDYATHEPQTLSGFHYASLAGWEDFFTFETEIINESLCIFARQNLGVFMILPPLGKWDSTTIECCFLHMKKTNKPGKFSRIENVPLQYINRFPSDRYDLDKRGYEYCYFKEDIMALEGQAYRSKRNDYNHFVAENNPCFLPYENSMKEECLALFDQWVLGRQKNPDDIYQTMIQENRLVHARLMEQAEELGLIGRIVMVKEKIVAYTFGYALTSSVFCDLLEITDLPLRGASAYIFRKFCRDQALAPFRFINCMDDFGMPNVGRAKMSYQPTFLLPIYSVTQK